MGFIEETGAAQHYRDAKILTIYEGTTAIQANDLVGRKTARDGGQAAKAIAAQVAATVADLQAHGSVDALAMAKRRLAREPVSRILGERSFWSFDLLVTPAVLDPRPDTETVVDGALEVLVERQGEALSILDLGTGSGALLCALLDVFPQAQGLGVDISKEACAVARENLSRCDLAPRGQVRQGSWEAGLPGLYDLVVSNPPYIESAALAGLDPEVRLYDPPLALDGGPDGLTAYRDICALLPALVAPGGFAIFEVGQGQAEAVATLLTSQGFREVRAQRDLAGVERAVMGQRAAG
jgi:release factor glutamine methyltransferase